MQHFMRNIKKKKGERQAFFLHSPFFLSVSKTVRDDPDQSISTWTFRF